MDTLVAAGQFLLNLLILPVNGLLEIMYQAVGHWAALISLACGLVMLVFDRILQRIEIAAPSRQNQKPPMNMVSRRHQLLSIITLLAWLPIGVTFPTPVPQLGAVMWLLTVLALLLVPTEQFKTLWRAKTAILAYCGVLVAFRVIAAWTLSADPREWAAIIGTVGEAQRIIASGRSIILSIVSYAAWFVVPAGYAMYLFQKMTAHPMVNPLARAGEIAWLIRQRPD
ncbi:MAG: hypothetical protein ACP5N6_09420 [Anaerolineae bacterium]|uniref:hypothetical protein n=1 Tax=Thermogutta sp. TaxID=1962930 RepID=UPI00321FD50D